MNKLKILIFFIITCLQSILAQENYIVRDISFIGNKTIPDSELQELITHYSTSWFSDYILFQDPFLFSSDIFDLDKKRIIKYYQRNGFLNVKISQTNLVSDSEKRTLEVEIEIEENEPITINDVNFSKKRNQTLPLLDSLQNSIELKNGKRFTEDLLTQDKNLIIDALINNGYPYADVDFELELDTLSKSVNIIWLLKEGKKSKFGTVNFDGNKRIENDLLSHKLKFQEGDLYRARKLDETHRSIYNLGLFYIVSVQPLLEKNNEIVPVRIKLEEAPKYNTKFGIGYGRDEKFRVSVEQRILSFLGGNRQLKIYAKHSALEPYNFRMDFLQPDFISEYTNLFISPFIIKQTEPAFKLNKIGFNAKLERPIFENIIGSIKYSFENSNLDTNSIAREELERYNLLSVYNKSGIEIGLERSTSVPLFNPNQGSITSLVLNYSGLGLNSKYHFIRPTLEYRRYIQTTDWLVFAFRIKAGTIFSSDDDQYIPFEERFYSGGSSSIRGWERADLGPKDKEGQPIGGKSVFESNIEFRHPIYSLFSGVAFLDYGNVWQNELTYKIDELRYSAGWGLRISTPIGPVRFDLAIPVFEGAAMMQYFITIGHAF
jgi:outer membrane protein insertion porin family